MPSAAALRATAQGGQERDSLPGRGRDGTGHPAPDPDAGFDNNFHGCVGGVMGRLRGAVRGDAPCWRDLKPLSDLFALGEDGLDLPAFA
jgi:hypothetical protein